MFGIQLCIIFSIPSTFIIIIYVPPLYGCSGCASIGDGTKGVGIFYCHSIEIQIFSIQICPDGLLYPPQVMECFLHPWLPLCFQVLYAIVLYHYSVLACFKLQLTYHYMTTMCAILIYLYLSIMAELSNFVTSFTVMNLGAYLIICVSSMN